MMTIWSTRACSACMSLTRQPPSSHSRAPCSPLCQRGQRPLLDTRDRRLGQRGSLGCCRSHCCLLAVGTRGSFRQQVQACLVACGCSWSCLNRCLGALQQGKSRCQMCCALQSTGKQQEKSTSWFGALLPSNNALSPLTACLACFASALKQGPGMCMKPGS